MKLFLDDMRMPAECASYMHRRIGPLNPIYLEGGWLIVKNYDEFVEAIKKYAEDFTHISYDHDLAEEHYIGGYDSEEEYYNSIKGTERTGLDCAKFMKNYYDEKKIEWPIMFVHSMNPVGTKAIIDLFND